MVFEFSTINLSDIIALIAFIAMIWNIHSRIDSNNTRIDSNNTRIDSLIAKMDAKFEKADAKFERMLERIIVIENEIKEIKIYNRGISDEKR